MMVSLIRAARLAGSTGRFCSLPHWGGRASAWVLLSRRPRVARLTRINRLKFRNTAKQPAHTFGCNNVLWRAPRLSAIRAVGGGGLDGLRHVDRRLAPAAFAAAARGRKALRAPRGAGGVVDDGADEHGGGGAELGCGVALLGVLRRAEAGGGGDEEQRRLDALQMVGGAAVSRLLGGGAAVVRLLGRAVWVLGGAAAAVVVVVEGGERPGGVRRRTGRRGKAVRGLGALRLPAAARW